MSFILAFRDGAPVLVSSSPALGDTAAGTPMRLVVSGTVTGVTIGGTACTSVVQVGTAVYCYAPAKAAASYDVIVSNGAGNSNTLTAAYEAWEPIAGITSGTARVYVSTAGVSSTGGLVDTWADQGTGAEDVTGVTTSRPRVVAGRFGENSKPSITWVATDGAGAGDKLMLAAPIAIPSAVSRFYVAKNIIGAYGGASSGSVVMDDPARVGVVSCQQSTGQMQVVEADIGVTRVAGGTDAYNDGAPRVYGITHFGDPDWGPSSALKFFASGSQVGSTQACEFGGTRVGWAGLGNSGALSDPFDGETAAIVTVEAVLSATEVTKLSQWLYGRFVARAYSFARVATATAWTARDGAAVVALGSDLYMLGGWTSEAGHLFNGDTSKVTNEVWKSTNAGVTWSLILAGDYTYHATVMGKNSAGTRWTPRHMHQAFVLGGLIYVIGSDPFIQDGPPALNNTGTGVGTSDVWTSPDGVTWTCVTSAAPWGPRINMMSGVIGTDIYVMGGQTNLNDDATALRDVWRSTDGGANWTQLADATWTHRGLVGACLPTMGGKIYLISGGVYGASGTPPAGALLYNNDVWSFDGTTWVQLSADGVAPLDKRRYASTLSFDAKLWVINGFGPLAAPLNIADCWSSPDGITWTQQTIPSWRTSHADGMCVLGDSIVMGPGNGCIGQPSGAGDGKVFKIVRNGVTP